MSLCPFLKLGRLTRKVPWWRRPLAPVTEVLKGTNNRASLMTSTTGQQILSVFLICKFTIPEGQNWYLPLVIPVSILVICYAETIQRLQEPSEWHMQPAQTLLKWLVEVSTGYFKRVYAGHGHHSEDSAASLEQPFSIYVTCSKVLQMACRCATGV